MNDDWQIYQMSAAAGGDSAGATVISPPPTAAARAQRDARDATVALLARHLDGR